VKSLLVKSCIAGLDELLYGGFHRNSTILVKGVPGTGKTTLGVEFIYRGIVQANEPGIIITFEEFPEQIYRDAANYGWDLPELEKRGLLRTVCTSPDVVLDPAAGLLDDLVQEIGARRLVLDSVTQLSMTTSDESQQRRMVYSVCSGLKRLGLTSILIREADDHTNNQVSFVEYVVDTVISLYFMESPSRRRRYLEIMKSRGQDFITGRHAFKFGSDGIKILRAGLSGMQQSVSEPPMPLPEKVSTGIAGLDGILSGGLLRGTTVTVEGDSGTGKTVAGLHYLLEGARRGERGLLLSTEESTAFLQVYAKTFDFGELAEALTNGDILVFDKFFGGTEPEEVIAEITTMVRQNSIRRLVIDSVNSFAEVVENPLVLKGYLRDLFRALNQTGCTTLAILSYDTVPPASYLTSVIKPLVQGEICLSTTVEKGRRKWLLEVTKMKGGKFTPGTHRAEISERGMEIFRRLGRR